LFTHPFFLFYFLVAKQIHHLTASHQAPIRIKAWRRCPEINHPGISLCPWHSIMPQKTFGSIPCPIDVISSTMVFNQPLLAHGMGKTVSHAIITMVL
jgi:hypothetical protein